MTPTPTLDPITVTVAQFKRVSGLGKTAIFDLIRRGELESTRIGGRRLILVESYRALITRGQDRRQDSLGKTL